MCSRRPNPSNKDFSNIPGRPQAGVSIPIRSSRGSPKGLATGGVWLRIGGVAAGVHCQLSLDSWERKVSDPWVLATIARGYRLQFRRRPPPFTRVRITSVKDPVQAKILAGEITMFLQKDAIVRVSTREQRAGLYSAYFLIPQKDGGLCPILNLRCLNAYVKVLPFKMLHIRDILESVEQGEWFTSIDLKDAYFHVPICQEHWQFFSFF